MPTSPARQAAFDILGKIGRDRGNSDSLLHSPLVDRLAPADRNLTTALVLGVLRWQRALDRECRRFLARPDRQLSEEVLLALRLGAFQLLLLDRIPAHAAIFESVEWVKHSPAARQSGLVNAVLRKVAALPQPAEFSAELAYPEWMVARWRRHYGTEACSRICQQGQQEPPATLRIFLPQSEAAILAPGVELLPGRILAHARSVLAGAIPAGAPVSLQDESSQLVAELAGAGRRILDCCAAPGGKTAILLENNPAAELLAMDIHPVRLEAMRRRLSALFPERRIEYRLLDAARNEDLGRFDLILCDVPCSGTGTLGRNPEIRHRLEPADLGRQAERQRAILAASLRRLAPGGRLLYSTCSLEPEENEAVVAACLQSRECRQLDLALEFDRLREQGTAAGKAVEALRATALRNGTLRTIPGLHPGDGFFAALIERS